MSYSNLTVPNNSDLFCNTITTKSFIASSGESTSTSTGGIVLIGGIGLSGNINGGGTIDIGGNLTVAGTDDTSDITTGAIQCAGGMSLNKSLIVHGTSDSSNTSSGSLQCLGGVGIAKNLYVGGGSRFANATFTGTNILLNNPANILISLGTSDCVGNNTGSIQTNGGVFIDKQLHAGSITCNGAELITSTTDLTNDTSGALRVEGGVSCGKSLSVGNSFSLLSPTGVMTIYSTVDASDTLSGALHVNGGVVIAKSMKLGATLDCNTLRALTLSAIVGSTVLTIVSGSTLSMNNITDSTDTATGSFRTVGGAYIAKTLRVGGSIVDLGTVNSTDNTTGALVVNGGVGIAKNLVYNGTMIRPNAWGMITNNIYISLNAFTSPNYTLNILSGQGIIINANIQASTVWNAQTLAGTITAGQMRWIVVNQAGTVSAQATRNIDYNVLRQSVIIGRIWSDGTALTVSNTDITLIDDLETSISDVMDIQAYMLRNFPILVTPGANPLQLQTSVGNVFKWPGVININMVSHIHSIPAVSPINNVWQHLRNTAVWGIMTNASGTPALDIHQAWKYYDAGAATAQLVSPTTLYVMHRLFILAPNQYVLVLSQATYATAAAATAAIPNELPAYATWFSDLWQFAPVAYIIHVANATNWTSATFIPFFNYV